MKKNVLFFLTLFIAIIASSAAFPQLPGSTNSAFFAPGDTNSFFKPLAEYPENGAVIQVAKMEINLFVGNIPDEKLMDYGFSSKEELGKITFDTPVRIYTLKGSDLVFTSGWRVPVVIDNEYRALLTVILQNGEYKIADFGARILAKEIGAKKTDQTVGLLRVYELRSDFLIEGFSNNQIKFVPIQGAKDKLYDLVEILNMIKK